MKTSYTVGEFKTHFSEALEMVKKGGTVSITYGRKRKPIAQLTPPSEVREPRLGLLAGKVTIEIGEDWEMDESEFLQS